VATLLSTQRASWRDYLELTKPKVVVLMLITSLAGMFLATRAGVGWSVLVFGNLGIGLCAGGAAVVNHVVDRRIDALMARTRKRPLAQGRVEPLPALLFALALALLGMALLLIFTNALTAWLTLASLLGYAVLYTGFLKRATPQNIVIGGLAGAAPPAHSAIPRLPKISTGHGTPARVARNMPTSEVMSISTTTFGLVSSR